MLITLMSPLCQLIIREVIAHWQLRHPNVVALLGIHQFDDEESGPPSMVLQFAEHPSARQYLKTHTGSQHFLRVVRISTLHPFLVLMLKAHRSRAFSTVYAIYTPEPPPVIHGDLHDVSPYLLTRISTTSYSISCVAKYPRHLGG